MPQEWTTTRWARVVSEVYVMMRVAVSPRKWTGGPRHRKLAAVKVTKRRWEIYQRKMKKSYGGGWSGTVFRWKRFQRGEDQRFPQRRRY